MCPPRAASSPAMRSARQRSSHSSPSSSAPPGGWFAETTKPPGGSSAPGSSAPGIGGGGSAAASPSSGSSPPPARPGRNRSRQPVADPSRARGEDEVERRPRPARDGRRELVRVPRAGEGEQRPQRVPRLQRGRAQRDRAARPLAAAVRAPGGPGDRAVAGFEHALLNGLAAAHGDALDPHPPARPAVRRAVAAGVGRVDRREVAVADVGHARGDAPGQLAAVPRDDAGQPRHARADRVDGSAAEVRDVEEAGDAGAQVRVAGQQRRPAGRALARHRPGVRRARGRAARRLRQPVGLQQPLRRARAGRARSGRAVRGVGDVDQRGALRADRRDQPRALQLGVPVGREAEHQEAAREQRVLGMPRLGPRPQQRVLRRQRAQAPHARVHPRRVGEKQRAVVGPDHREVAPRAVGEAEAAHQPVALQRPLAGDLGEPPGREPPVEVELEEAVLGMDEALPEDRVRLAGRVDVGHAEAVAHHLQRRARPVRLDPPVHGRMRPPAARRGERARRPRRPPRDPRHRSAPPITPRWYRRGRGAEGKGGAAC